jgi:hypothetical protein
MDSNNTEMSAALAERFNSLPKIVQDAIMSADVQAHLRELAKTHKLHVDQWQVLENNVMLTLLGFQPAGELQKNLKEDLEIADEAAHNLSEAISSGVFAPIRSEMEKNLDHPTVVQEAESTIEGMRREALEGAAKDAAAIVQSAAPAAQAPTPAATPPTPVAPGTPPPPGPTEKSVRGSVAATYTGSASHERKSIEGDPYREQLL